VFRGRNLRKYDVVVFLNTTGIVMDGKGRVALERYIRDGGGWVGIHSAADTEYDWDFYGKLLAGAWFKCHPLEQPGTIVREAAKHASTRHLPERWDIPIEEFYSFKKNPRPRTRVLLSIDESSYFQDPNTSDLPSQTYPDDYEPVSGVMGDHPMSWTHRVGDGRVWYTALGHEVNMYLDDSYRRHLRGGILSAAGRR
jgi:type 1 glutamine amidotransferase